MRMKVALKCFWICVILLKIFNGDRQEKMFPLIGLAAVALGVFAFDLSGSNDDGDDEASSTNNNKTESEEVDFISLASILDDNDYPDETDFAPELNSEETSDSPSDATVDLADELDVFDKGPDLEDDVQSHPINDDGDVALGRNQENGIDVRGEIEVDDPDGTHTGVPEEPSGDTGKTFGLVGTDGNDSLAGVNVHIDVATGIVDLFGNTAEILSGGGGNDVLAIGAGDFAVGGLGEDEFVVDGHLNSIEQDVGAVPTISDFLPGQDQIVVSMPTSEQQLEEIYPNRPSNDFELSFECNDDETLIFVGELLVCKLVGEFDLSGSDVSVQYDYHSSLKTDFDERYGY